MSLHTVDMPNMVTSAGGTISSVIKNFDDGWAVVIYTTENLTSTAVTIAVSWNSSSTSDFVTLQSAGSNVTINPVTGMLISPTPFRQLRLEHSAAEGSARTFHVTKMVIT